LKSIKMLSATPITLSDNTFRNINPNYSIFVPETSISAYQNAEGWKNHSTKIKAFA
jgi:hypothetical protein